MFFKKKDVWLSEEEITTILLNWRGLEEGTVRLTHFLSVWGKDLFYPYSLKYDGFYVIERELRENFGFAKDKKPGDFDVLLIPFVSDLLYYEMSIALEIKIVRPTRKKPEKNADSLGVTQANGMVMDGFPYVGLIHVSMTEPLLEEEKSVITYIPSNVRVSEEGEHQEVKVDHFSWYSADKQTGRLFATSLYPSVGFNCIGLEVLENNGISLISGDQDFAEGMEGSFNPHFKLSAVKKIQRHFKDYPNKYRKLRIK